MANTKAQNQANFDAAWTSEESYWLNFADSDDGGDLYYVLGGIIGHTLMLRATGELKYLDAALTVIEKVIATAKYPNEFTRPGNNFTDNYKGWQDHNEGITNGVGVNNGTQVPLAESHGLRDIAELLHIMSLYPSLRTGTYQTRYDTILEFMETHIWDKWYSRSSGNIYRTYTWMASHFAKIALHLWGATGKAKYKTVIDNFMTNMSAGGRSSSMMEQFFSPPYSFNPNGVMWNGAWGDYGTRGGDHSHMNAEVAVIVDCYEMGLYKDTGLSTAYPDLNDSLIQKLCNTFIAVANGWGAVAHGYLNGTSNSNVAGAGSNRSQFDYGWPRLAGYNLSVQEGAEGKDLSQQIAAKYLNVYWGCLTLGTAQREGTEVYPFITSGGESPTDPPIDLPEEIAIRKKQLDIIRLMNLE